MTNSSSLTIASGGTLTNQSGGTVANNATLNQTGTFTNNGTYGGTGMHVGFFSNPSGRKLAPGNSAGCLTFQNAITLGGTYQVELGGTTACSQHDKFSITDGFEFYNLTISSGTVVEVSYLNGYLPPANYLYGILKKQGAAYIVSHFDQLPEEGGFSERHSGILNKAGYSLMSQGKADEAIEVFAVNVQLFPKEANPYDSLAEAYLKKGDKENALKYYKKALELDPEFPSAKRMAGELEGKE